MNAQELRLKNAEELRRLAEELRGQLREVRFKLATRQASTGERARALRKDVARVETVRRAQRAAASSSSRTV